MAKRQISRAVDGDRLWDRLMALAAIGATSDDGVNRQALSDEEVAARRRLISWGQAIGLAASNDKAAKRMADEHARFLECDLSQEGIEFVEDTFEASRAGRLVAPTKSCPIVRTCARKFRDCREHRSPTERRGSNSRFE